MSELMKKIEYAFANLEEGKAMPVSGVEGAAEGWLLREKQGVMIAALPSDYGRAFDETFSGIHMRTSSRWIDDNKRDLIIIESDQFENRRPFARICEDFLSEEQGPRIGENPKEWWQKWKELMGNSNTSKAPHAVIGELLVTLEMIKKGIEPNWTGPDGASHDIETERRSFEVKSTTERVDEIVSISNQHQLSVSEGKSLYLILCRFEYGQGNLSINSVSEQLIAAGFDEDYLENKLKKLGHLLGRTSRSEIYGLLSADVYAVDDKFPRIVPESFKEESFPPGVIKLVYDISLSNLNRVSLNEFLGDIS